MYIPENGYTFAPGTIDGSRVAFEQEIYYSPNIVGDYTSAGSVYIKVTGVTPSNQPIWGGGSYNTDKGAGYYKFNNWTPSSYAGSPLCLIGEYILDLPKVNLINIKDASYLENFSQLLAAPGGNIIFKPTVNIKVTTTDINYVQIYRASSENGNYELISNSSGTWNLDKDYYYKFLALSTANSIVGITIGTNIPNEEFSSSVQFQGKNLENVMKSCELVRYYYNDNKYSYPPATLDSDLLKYQYNNGGEYIYYFQLPTNLDVSIAGSTKVYYSSTIDGPYTLLDGIESPSQQSGKHTFSVQGTIGYYKITGGITSMKIGSYGKVNYNFPKVEILEKSSNISLSNVSSAIDVHWLNAGNSYFIFKPSTDLKVSKNYISGSMYRSNTQNGNYVEIYPESGVWNLSKDYYYKFECNTTSREITGNIYMYAINLKEMESGMSLVQFVTK